jgi:uncharacterized protein
VYAHREDTPNHQAYRGWLESVINADEAFGMADIVLSGFIRIVTHPKIFAAPTPLERALDFVNALREPGNCVTVAPGPRHWQIFDRLCRHAATKGNLVADAYLAALAIESESEWVTTDGDFSRFPGLRRRHPLSTERN